MSDWEHVSAFVRTYVREHRAIPDRDTLIDTFPDKATVIDQVLIHLADRIESVSDSYVLDSLANFGLGPRPRYDHAAIKVLRERFESRRSNFDERMEKIRKLLEKFAETDPPPPDDVA